MLCQLDRLIASISIAPLLLIAVSVLGSCAAVTTAEEDGTRAKNDAVIKTAQANIEKYRKGPAKIKVVDAKGKALANTHLKIRQISHDFKFGCYFKIDDLDPADVPKYSQQFKQLFNYAVIGMYWRHMEKKQGAPDWMWFDREAALGQKLGLRLESAPVLWGTNEYGRPNWLPDTKDELMPVLEHRVKSAVTRDSGISDWEIVNEPLSRKMDGFALAATDEYISSAFNWAREAAPEKRLLINESGIFGDGPERNYNADRYFDLVKGLIEKGVPVDVIGIQAHAKGEWYEPSKVAEQLDKYASLGKPIQITEFSSQTRNDQESPIRITGSHAAGKWDNEKQADFYREFYTVVFGTPQVEAIVTWGLDDQRAWLPGVGLIRRNGELKPAYQTLDKLINHDWMTSLDVTTDENGFVDFRGFYGAYTVTTEGQNNKPAEFTFQLVKDHQNDWVAHIGS